MSAKRSRVRPRARAGRASSRRPFRSARSTRALVTRPRSQAPGDPFRHVVLLMLENRSFDHMVGALQGVVPDVDGVPPNVPPRSNPDIAGVPVEQLPVAEPVVDPDPLHETPNVLNQLDDANGRFVKDYQRGYPDISPAQKQAVMAYHALGSLQALHTLGQAFVVCDRWFCSVPGPTWTNRLFAMSGTSLGRVKMPEGIFHPNLHSYDQPSVFRRIQEAGLSHRIYFGDFPLALLLADQRRLSAALRFRPLDDFFDDAAGAESDFPDFAFLEPRYMTDADDDHPPHDVSNGERLVNDVYTALRANQALWESTLLVVAYDEHGGFYDHVATPAAVPPDGHHEEYTFDRLGVRVPVLLVSPWIRPHVVHSPCDHTALLKSLTRKWNLGPLGARVAQAPDILAEVELAPAVRDDAPERLLPARARLRARAAPRAAARAEMNDHQRAIVALSAYLESLTPTTPAATKVRAATRTMQSPADAQRVAVERAQRYLAQFGARARRRR
jgi:phospholipase C